MWPELSLFLLQKETDDGKDEKCGKFGKQVTKRIRICKREYTN